MTRGHGGAVHLTPAGLTYRGSHGVSPRSFWGLGADTQWQRDLSISHNKIGDVARAEGDLAAARNEYQASLDIVARLVDLDPLNAQWRSDLEFTRQQLGRIDQSAEGQA